MPSFDAQKSQDGSLIRKALGGAFFIGPEGGTAPVPLTTYTAGPPEVIDLIDLGAIGLEDLGYTSDDGIGFENETSQSDTTSWQSTAPTRSDIVSDTDTVTVVAQETKLLTLGLYTGADPAAMTLAANTYELGISKPERPSARFYRGLTLAVDGSGADEFFIGRYYPRLKVTGKVGQRYGKGDDPISYGVTLTAFVDSTLGYSSRYLFGGRGWKAKATAMGFTIPA